MTSAMFIYKRAYLENPLLGDVCRGNTTPVSPVTRPHGCSRGPFFEADHIVIL